MFRSLMFAVAVALASLMTMSILVRLTNVEGNLLPQFQTDTRGMFKSLKKMNLKCNDKQRTLTRIYPEQQVNQEYWIQTTQNSICLQDKETWKATRNQLKGIVMVKLNQNKKLASIEHLRGWSRSRVKPLKTSYPLIHINLLKISDFPCN